MRRIALLTVLGCCGSLPAYATEPRTWELTPDGRWQQTEAVVTTTRPATDAQLAQVQSLLDRRRYDAAFHSGVRWLLANRDSPVRDEGLFLVARALRGAGDPVKAFYYCDELLDTYPESPFWLAAVELQFDIASQLLGGWRRTFLGIPLAGWTDEGIEMMFRIQQRAPGSVLSERALMRTADFYFDDEQYDLAADAYGVFVNRYSRSPDAIRARLRQAYANYAQFTGVRFDPTPAINARQQFEALILQYPEVAEQQRLEELVDSIDRSLARKLLVTADFYRRTNQPTAASKLLAVLVEEHPGTPEADEARALLAALPPPPPVLDMTPPALPQDAGPAPTTRP